MQPKPQKVRGSDRSGMSGKKKTKGEGGENRGGVGMRESGFKTKQELRGNHRGPSTPCFWGGGSSLGVFRSTL